MQSLLFSELKNMATTIFSKIACRMLAVFISIVYTFNPYVAPSTSDKIEGCDENGANMTFVAWADSQLSNYMAKRYQFFDAACEDVANAGNGVDALMIAGDIAENGLLCEYQYVTDHLKDAKVDNFLMAVGNHDVRLKIYKNTVKNFTAFTNNLNKAVGSELTIDKLHYTYEIKGYKFIVLGTDRTEFEESYISNEQLSWLDSELKSATSNGAPVFVIIHQTFKLTHGLPKTWNSPIDSAGSVGAQSDELYEIMNRYQNVFLISGHLHTGIGQYTYEKLGKINSINLPSLTINNKDGECNDNGIGFMVEVYDSHILFRARNFAKGEYIPDYDIDIPIE